MQYSKTSIINLEDKFGFLTIKQETSCGQHGSSWECLCVCGNNRTYQANELLAGRRRSCGCKRRVKTGNIKDYSGRVFGKLQAVSYLRPNPKEGGSIWLFKCQCGKEIERPVKGVVCGDTRSCGCYKTKLYIESRTMPGGQAIKNAAYHTYTRTCIKRGMAVGLTKEQYLSIASKPCLYCGVFSKRRKYHQTNTITSIELNSVDRLNNERYYTLENSVPCCFECQKAKGVMSAEKYIAMCKRVAAHE